MKKTPETHSSALGLAPLGLLILLAGAATAQEDPFGAAPKPAGAAAAPTAKLPVPVDPTKRDPLVIELLRASNTTTPLDLLQAAQSALQYGRADESKRYLAKLVADKPADDALATFTARFSDFLLELGRTKEVQPEGKQVADLIFSAAQRTTQNPERIAAAIAQLSDPLPGKRDQAIERLSAAGTHIVNPMLAALADPARDREHAAIRLALVALAPTTELPLLGALDTSNSALQSQVIAMLGRMRSKRAALPLIPLSLDPKSPSEIRQLAAAALQAISGAAPDRYEGEQYLRRYVDQYLRGDLDYERSVEDLVTLWYWDEVKQGVFPSVLPRPDAAAQLAGEVAGYLYQLKPADETVRRLKLLTELERVKLKVGLDRPLPLIDLITGRLGATPGDVNQVLLDAMRLGRVTAAIAAAEVLGQMGEPAILYVDRGKASPLAQAMVHSDRRVRLAAALTCVKLANGASFPGAGRFSETLGWFIGTSGANSVLIGDPRGEDAQSVVGFMNVLGYEGETAYVGRRLAERAFANPDHEFILIADAIDGPPVEELVQWLRRDFRTARQPIGVMARGERFEKLREALADDRLVTVFPRIHSVDVAAVEVSKLVAIAGRNLVGRDERLTQARAALAALTLLAKNPATFAHYDLLAQEPAIIRALENPALAAESASLLALYGTPKAQWALLEFASRGSSSFADRKAAANAFAAAIQRRGLRLTQQAIREQYARYNASQKTQDLQTNELLGSILDAIEAPAIAREELSRRE